MIDSIRLKRGLESVWTAKNPVLASGELAVVFSDETLMPLGIKIGNGNEPFINLPFIGEDSSYTKQEIDEMLNIIRNDITELTNDISEIKIGKDLISLERLGSYTYRATFDSLPRFIDIYDDIPSGCTSFVKDGKLYRNLDWSYDNMAIFWVKCKSFEGMAEIHGLNDGELDKEKLEQLPYHLLDGRNDFGIRISTHILYNDWGFDGSGDKNFPLYLLPYKVLSNISRLTTPSALQHDLEEYLNNIKIYDSLKQSEYLLQFLVTDGTHTFIISPPTSESGTYIVLDTANNVERLTNFRYVPIAELARNAAELQLRPIGVERWNLINETVSLKDLRYTLAYESDDRLSEFIGENYTTKFSTDAELEAIYQVAKGLYEERTRDGATWQTLYSVVYSADKIESLFTQENYNVNYVEESNSEIWESGSGENSIQQKGTLCEASGDDAIATGLNTHAGATASHTEGALTTTRNDYDEETETGFDAAYSHVEGLNNATNNIAEHGQGKYGWSYYDETHDPSKCSISYTGIGTNDQDIYRKNGEAMMLNGDKYLIGIGGYEGKIIENVSTVQEVINSKMDSIDSMTNDEIDALWE